ncbi:unnamed protein product [Boreogadus saida]
MGDWSSLSELLDKVQAHSTVVGKIWMSVLLVFRILVLGVAADEVWGDEQSHFFCNNEEPGCTLACYNWMFPVSYIRYWVLQILLVSTPTLVYLGHAVHVIHRERRLRERLQGHDKGAADALRKPKYTDDRGKIVIKGILLRSYLAQLVVKILLEVGFVVGQFYLYDSPIMVPFFHCLEDPCPRRIGVECFISRPTEKSIFVVFMLAVAGVSVFLNLLEILYLLCARKRQGQKKKRAALTDQEHYLSGKDLKLSGGAIDSAMTTDSQTRLEVCPRANVHRQTRLEVCPRANGQTAITSWKSVPGPTYRQTDPAGSLFPGPTDRPRPGWRSTVPSEDPQI